MKVPISRFDLFVVVRNQVADRRRVRRALAVEAAMEALARLTGNDAVAWGLTGLGHDIDAGLVDLNPDRRGAVAESLLVTEGVPAECAAAARLRLVEEPAAMAPMTAALVVAETVVDEIFLDVEAGDPLDALDHRLVARRLDKRSDDEAARARACAGRLGIALDAAAAAVVPALDEIREDLHL